MLRLILRTPPRSQSAPDFEDKGEDEHEYDFATPENDVDARGFARNIRRLRF